MSARRFVLVLIVVVLTVSLVEAQNRVGRRAGRGAAMGAVFGLLLGGDIDDAIEGAAVGAATGAVGGAIDNSYAKKDKQRYYEQQKAQQLAQAEAKATEAERQRMEAERRALEAEQLQAEAAATPETVSIGGDSLTEEQWIDIVGVDNWNAVVALVDCQYDRSRLLAQAGATVDDPEYRLASKWVEMLIAVDTTDSATGSRVAADLVKLDSDLDTVQQVSIEADKAILDIRQIRREEGISCKR